VCCRAVEEVKKWGQEGLTRPRGCAPSPGGLGPNPSHSARLPWTNSPRSMGLEIQRLFAERAVPLTSLRQYALGLGGAHGEISSENHPTILRVGYAWRTRRTFTRFGQDTLAHGGGRMLRAVSFRQTLVAGAAEARRLKYRERIYSRRADALGYNLVAREMQSGRRFSSQGEGSWFHHSERSGSSFRHGAQTRH
jgi:hypothetical protein